MGVVTISADQEIFEVGAQIMGVATFPNDPDRARGAATAWCAEYVQEHIRLFPETAGEVRANYAPYATMKKWDIRRHLRSAKTQLRYRSVAARMSRGFFFENIFSEPAELPDPMLRHSIGQLCILVKRESRQHDPKDTEKRIWRSSRNIIHLATAIEQELDPRPANDVGVRIDDYDLMSRILRRAELHEKIVLGDHRFGVDPDNLVRVRVA